MIQLTEKLEKHRLLVGDYGTARGDRFGAFIVPGPCGRELTIIADDGAAGGVIGGWEHVSVSTTRHPPNWREMCFVKDLFWPPEDCVVQYHPPASKHVNNHPRCLHLWRWTRGDFPAPPPILVGIKELGELQPAWSSK